MKCSNIRELMSAYIDNELNEVDKAKFEKHIAQCPQCKEEYELLKDVVLECTEIDEEELPESFREELHNKLLEAKAARPSKLTVFMRKNKWVTAASAVAAVLIIAVSLGTLGMPKTANFETAQSAPAAEPSSNGLYNDAAMAKDSAGSANMGIASVEAPPAAAPSPTATIAPEFSGQMNPDATMAKGKGIEEGTAELRAADTTEQIRKIIKNGNISLEVADLQARINEITALTVQTGGYVESSYVDNVSQPGIMIEKDGKQRETSTQNAYMVIKVPAEKYESSFQAILGMGKAIRQGSNSGDVTLQYRDLEVRIENLKLQEKNLQEIMAKATTVKDILEVENNLNRVRTEIDLMTGNLKNWDQLVEYSTININMTEVKVAELEKVDVPGVWQKAQQGFINAINNIQVGLERLFVFLISALPYLVILGVGSLLAVLWIKKRNKN